MSKGLPAPCLQTERLQLTLPSRSAAVEALTFHQRNLAHLAPWSPPIPANAGSLDHWIAVADHAIAAFEAGTMVRLWVHPLDADALVIGSIGFSQMTRGPFCHAVLGYQIDAAYQGRGLMREALGSAISYMFEVQRLHRISANYRPENTRSGALLARLGFRIEGVAERYLFIDGEWRDHILTSRTNDAFDPAWLAGPAPAPPRHGTNV